MDKAVEQRIKEMKETAEKMQQLKKEVMQEEKKNVPQTEKKNREDSKRATLAWSTEIKCDIPYYLL